MGIGKFFNAETASSVVNGVKKVAGFTSGVAGYFTGLAPQVEEAVAEMAGKGGQQTFGHVLKNSSGLANKNLAAANLLKGSLKEAEKGHGVMGYELSSPIKAAVIGLAGVSAVRGAVSDSYKASMGQVAPMTQAPPSMTYDYEGMPAAGKDTGADGNLVFALNKLRRG